MPDDRQRDPQIQHLELVQLINGIVWEADPVTRVNTFVSDRITSLLGYTPEQWRSPGFWETHIHPDDRTRIVAEGEALMGRAQPYQLEYRMTRADGQTMWLRDLITPVFQGGVMVKLGGVMLDITAEKNAQTELLAARARFSRIIESSPVGMVLSDIRTSRVLETNDAFLRIINCPRAIFMGEEDDFNPWVSADDRAELVRRLKEDRTVRDFETLHQRRSTGEQRDVLISAEYLDIDGQETLLVMAQDITDRKASERAKAATEARFQALVQNSSDVITIANRGGFLTYVSPSMEPILRHQADEVIGHNVLSYMHPDEHEQIREAFTQVVIGGPGTSVRRTSRFRRGDGEYIWLEWAATNRYHDPSVRGIVMNSRDVTERQKAEEALQARENRFRALVHNSGDLLFVINRRGYITYASESVDSALGVTQPEGRNILEFIHPDEHEETRRDFAEVVLVGREPLRAAPTA
ncbi:PAS domain S-box protein [Deinococcus malanensis]|uniref:PAS domain S-box protein n=1 Tax=Deinococcus malanensis TaxID=1706855 RepID=UPI0036264CCD